MSTHDYTVLNTEDSQRGSRLVLRGPNSGRFGSRRIELYITPNGKVLKVGDIVAFNTNTAPKPYSN